MADLFVQEKKVMENTDDENEPIDSNESGSSGNCNEMEVKKDDLDDLEKDDLKSQGELEKVTEKDSGDMIKLEETKESEKINNLKLEKNPEQSLDREFEDFKDEIEEGNCSVELEMLEEPDLPQEPDDLNEPVKLELPMFLEEPKKPKKQNELEDKADEEIEGLIEQMERYLLRMLEEADEKDLKNEPKEAKKPEEPEKLEKLYQPKLPEEPKPKVLEEPYQQQYRTYEELQTLVEQMEMDILWLTEELYNTTSLNMIYEILLELATLCLFNFKR